MEEDKNNFLNFMFGGENTHKICQELLNKIEKGDYKEIDEAIKRTL